MLEQNKQIEEMAKMISNSCDDHDFDLKECEIDLIAIDLYYNGYRKVDRDGTKTADLARELIEAKNKIERLKAEKAEAVHEFAKNLKNLVLPMPSPNGVVIYKQNLYIVIDELLEEIESEEYEE